MTAVLLSEIFNLGSTLLITVMPTMHSSTGYIVGHGGNYQLHKYTGYTLESNLLAEGGGLDTHGVTGCRL